MSIREGMLFRGEVAERHCSASSRVAQSDPEGMGRMEESAIVSARRRQARVALIPSPPLVVLALPSRISKHHQYHVTFNPKVHVHSYLYVRLFYVRPFAPQALQTDRPDTPQSHKPAREVAQALTKALTK